MTTFDPPGLGETIFALVALVGATVTLGVLLVGGWRKR